MPSARSTGLSQRGTGTQLVCAAPPTAPGHLPGPSRALRWRTEGLAQAQGTPHVREDTGSVAGALARGGERGHSSPCFLCLQGLLEGPCVLGGQGPPGRVWRDQLLPPGPGLRVLGTQLPHVPEHPGCLARGGLPGSLRPGCDPRAAAASGARAQGRRLGNWVPWPSLLQAPSAGGTQPATSARDLGLGQGGPEGWPHGCGPRVAGPPTLAPWSPRSPGLPASPGYPSGPWKRRAGCVLGSCQRLPPDEAGFCPQAGQQSPLLRVCCELLGQRDPCPGSQALTGQSTRARLTAPGSTMQGPGAAEPLGLPRTPQASPELAQKLTGVVTL